jgi:hypothetical protein
VLVCVVLSGGPGAPAGVWGPSRRGGAVVTSPFFGVGAAGARRRQRRRSVRHLPQMNETHGCPALHVHVLEYSFSLIPRSRGWTVDASDRTSTARCAARRGRWVRRVRPRRPLARVVLRGTYVPSERGAGALQGGASVVLCPKQGVWGVERTQLFAFGQAVWGIPVAPRLFRSRGEHSA